MITAIISILGTNVLTAIFKDAVKKFGNKGVHILVFAFAIVFTGITALAHAIPSVQVFLEQAAAYGLAAIGTYEILWRKISNTVDIPPEIMSS